MVLRIRDVCMDLEPCSKVHNLVVIQLNRSKLVQMTPFINWIKSTTRASTLLNLKVAHKVLNGWNVWVKISRVAVSFF